jgi:nucleoid DNA-binding protein
MLYKLCEQLDDSISSSNFDFENLIYSFFKEINGCDIEENNLHVNPTYINKKSAYFNKKTINKEELLKLENEIIANLKSGKIVKFYNFGKFRVINVKERKSRDPRTGKEITISAHKRVLFTPFKHFKEAVQN